MKIIQIQLGIILLFLFIETPLRASVLVSKTDTIEIFNKILSVKISLNGAEIISLFNKKQKFEHIWQAEEESWNQHAPILFPIVGKLKDGSYQIDGKTYKMKNHGFASHSLFSVVSKTSSKVILLLKSSSETLNMYPYQFEMLVKYELIGNKLNIINTVKNMDTKEIFFSIGAHPGFNIPFYSHEAYDDYYLGFEQNETVARLPLTAKKGLLSEEKIKKYLDNTNKLPLNHQLFKDRAVILEGLKSKSVTIKSNTSKMSVTVGIAGFPFLGVWTSFKTDAPFICIEPWYGISDVENSTGDFKNKKGIQSLQPGNSFYMNYFIEIKNFK